MARLLCKRLFKQCCKFKTQPITAKYFSSGKLHEIEEKCVSINGTKIKYVRCGSGPHAVFCFPGALGSAWMHFKDQIEGLDRTKLTLVVWDPPGYGLSRPPNRDLRPGYVQRDAELALGLMKILNLPKFSILAWSAGTFAAIVLASTYPQYVDKIVLWGAGTYVSEWQEKIFQKIRDVNNLSEQFKTPMVELYGLEDFQIMWEQWMDELLRIHRENMGEVCSNELKLIRNQILVLHGKEDSLVNLELPRRIVEKVDGARLYLFENGKHGLHMQYPDKFNSMVMDFLMQSRSAG